MAIEIDVHPAQSAILKELLFVQGTRFTKLNKTGLTHDHFTFHLNRLLELTLIEKADDGCYRLTPKGKEFANRFDTEKKVVERQAKVAVLVIAVKKEDRQEKYLVQQRLKQPFFGFHGFVSGKVRWEETIEGAARRELLEEAGLTGKFRFVGVLHEMNYALDGELLEDKYFFVVRVDVEKDKLKESFEGGENRWLSFVKINRSPRLFQDVPVLLHMVKQPTVSFLEKKYTESEY